MKIKIGAKRCIPALLAVLAIGVAGPALADTGAQGQSGSSDDDMFGTQESVQPAATSSQEADNKSGFLKYDQVKVGGSFKGVMGISSIYDNAWGGGTSLVKPDQYYLSPDIEGRVTLTAKPDVDFGVNMEVYSYWPYSTTATYLSSAASTKTSTSTIPYLDIWSMYAKTNWQDRVYFSFGKQPIAWGVSKGAFQPADDIFAASSSIDLSNTTAEREGPLALKVTVPLGVTNNFYFYAGLPSSYSTTNTALSTSATGSATSVEIDPAQTRFAAKAEYGFGDTELALAGFYSYKDSPRVLLMGTTSLAGWNIFGEGIVKYGSNRYFISSLTSAAQQSNQFYFTGDIGAYYMDSDSGLTFIVQYLYNGEAQTQVSAETALLYYIANSSEYDSARLGTHYAFASISDTNLFPTTFGKDKLGASLITIANLSDGSGYVMPSVSWTFFDYLILKVGASFNFGGSGSEYISYGVGQSFSSAGLPTTAGMALTASLTVATGSF